MKKETRKILITVKAYPNQSKKHDETVCAAGIDIDRSEWVRLYPIPFRDLEKYKRFKKYNIIEVCVSKPSNDKRPESLRVETDSIKILDILDSKDGWREREKIILPTVSDSMCEIIERNKTKSKSLGMFMPCDIDFKWEKKSNSTLSKKSSNHAQLSFYNPNKKILETIPYKFKYIFKCKNNFNCPGHRYSIIDWEIGEAYRKWRDIYKTVDELLLKIKQRWLTEICSPNNNVYFFVGNHSLYTGTFMILGAFYPPSRFNQLELFNC